MIIELIQLVELVSSLKVRPLILCALALLINLISLSIKARKHREIQDGFRGRYEVIIPLYREDPKTLMQNLESLLSQSIKPERITVICDADEDGEIFEICRRYGVEIIASPIHLSKREAIITGIRNAITEFILQVDSDVRLHPSCVENLFKPFVDPSVGSVSPRNKIFPEHMKSFSGRFSACLEGGRHVVNSALDPRLAVVDGRGALFNAKALRQVLEEFENEEFRGKKIETSEDELLTELLLRNGWKTKYQPNAVLETAAPVTIKRLIKQQLR